MYWIPVVLGILAVFGLWTRLIGTPPTFPFTNSTINSTRPNTICLKTHGWHEEHRANSGVSSNLYPGEMLSLQSNDTVLPHGVYGGIPSALLFAKEDALAGNWFLNPYNSGDLVSCVSPKQGDHLLVIVNPGAPAILEGDSLISAGDGTFVKSVASASGGSILYSQVADSAAYASATAETPFTTGFTLPANFFQVGDVIKFKVSVDAIGVTSTPTLNVKLKGINGAGSPVTITLLATGAVTMAAADLVEIEYTMVVRTIGATGTIVGEGTFISGVPGTADPTPVALASTTFDTTQTWQFEVTGTWSASSSSNTALLRIFNIEINRSLSVVGVAAEAIDNSGGSTFEWFEMIVR